MYFRTKTIKNTKLVQLIESYRGIEGRPRQRVIASLGDAKIPENEKKPIARAVDRNLTVSLQRVLSSPKSIQKTTVD